MKEFSIFLLFIILNGKAFGQVDTLDKKISNLDKMASSGHKVQIYSGDTLWHCIEMKGKLMSKRDKERSEFKIICDEKENRIYLNFEEYARNSYWLEIANKSVDSDGTEYRGVEHLINPEGKDIYTDSLTSSVVFSPFAITLMKRNGKAVQFKKKGRTVKGHYLWGEIVTLPEKRDENSDINKRISDVIYIKHGTSFGFCKGYCYSVSIISQDKVIKTQIWWQKGGRDTINYPNKVDTASISKAKWSQLVKSVDIVKFFNLPETIGHPDGLDEGAEWIEIMFQNRVHRVTFSYGTSVEGMTTILEELRKKE
jgi:hypothetical protein